MGQGGNVNRTESAVRVSHEKSGLSVRIESERSQHRNRALALAVLAQALQRKHQQQLASAKAARRLRSMQVERGLPVKVWRMEGERLVLETA